MKTVQVLYFASLRDAAGADTQCVQTSAACLRELYQVLQREHGFELPVQRLRVAVDGRFAQWHDPVRVGSEVAFIPPVSGG